jgi:hypothetical protein
MIEESGAADQPLSRLPVELHCDIFALAAQSSLKDTLSLSLVSSWVRHAIIPVMYRTVRLNNGNIDSFLRSLDLHQTHYSTDAESWGGSRHRLVHVKNFSYLQFIHCESLWTPEEMARLQYAVWDAILSCVNLESLLINENLVMACELQHHGLARRCLPGNVRL